MAVELDKVSYAKFLDGLDKLTEEKRKTRVNSKLEQLVKDNKTAVVINDWKATTQQFKDAAKILSKVEGGFVHHYESFFDFASGSGDDLVTVVTDKQISDDHAEIIADLVYNLGAETEELISQK